MLWEEENGSIPDSVFMIIVMEKTSSLVNMFDLWDSMVLVLLLNILHAG